MGLFKKMKTVLHPSWMMVTLKANLCPNRGNFTQLSMQPTLMNSFFGQPAMYYLNIFCLNSRAYFTGCSNISPMSGSSHLFHFAFHRKFTTSTFGTISLCTYLKWNTSAPFSGMSCICARTSWIVVARYSRLLIIDLKSSIGQIGCCWCSSMAWIHTQTYPFISQLGYFRSVAVLSAFLTQLSFFPFSQKSGLYSTFSTSMGLPLQSTHTPVSPSYSQPWKGHWMHLPLTTLPPTPRWAPRCLQQASSAYASPFSDRNTTMFSPAMSTACELPFSSSSDLTATYQPLGQDGRGLPMFFCLTSQSPRVRNMIPLNMTRQKMQNTAVRIIASKQAKLLANYANDAMMWIMNNIINSRHII